MEFDFLKPIDATLLDFAHYLEPQQLGKKVFLHTEIDFPILENCKIVIIGVKENRGDKNSVENVNLNHIRQELYQLYLGNWNFQIADLGDIEKGSNLNDSYFALQNLTNELLKLKIIPVIIGGSQDLTYPMYRAYDQLEQMVNLVAIDSKFDLGRGENENTNQTYLSKIIIEEPVNLFNYSNIGLQSHYNSQEEIDLIEKLNFEYYRLGTLTSNITLAEPTFRNADLVSLDMNAVKSADSGNFKQFNPNGFDGKEICAIARYSGISDRVSSFGIFNHQSSPTEAPLIAQIIWYFLEGFNFRSNEYPFSSKVNYIKFTVLVEEQEIIFYKSDKTERWWIEVNLIIKNNKNTTKRVLLPCSYEEYVSACNQIIPERWWKAQQKNII